MLYDDMMLIELHHINYKIKDWLELVWDDTTEIEINIEELKQQYNLI